MAGGLQGLIDRMLSRWVLRRWSRAVVASATQDLESLRRLRSEARALRRPMDQALRIAEARLALPLLGANPLRHPPGTDWCWRPDLWRAPLDLPGVTAMPTRTTLGDGVTLFHDCKISEITVRQVRNTRDRDLAPFGLRLDVFRFDGSFLSAVIDLPAAAVQGLRLKHLIRLEMQVEVEKPIEIFARLNVRHGPNTEQIVREVALDPAEAVVEFDLFYTRLNEKRVEQAWIDLIFEGPEMNQVAIRDLTVGRRPRAEL